MVGSRLNLKLIRDLKFSPLMFAGIVLLVIVGIALFGASYELYLNLGSSYRLSYGRLKLADFSVAVQSTPEDVLSTLRKIPGVADVQGRVIEEVEIEQPEVASRKVVGRLISLPDTGEPTMNKLRLLRGAYPRRDTSREILLEASFAKYHNYRPGSLIQIVVLGDKVRFRVCGIVQSPEYIYVVRGREYPMPSPRTFGVMWARKAIIDKLFGTSGALNDVEFVMSRGGNSRTAMRLASQILRPYGADDPVPQRDQASVELLRLDMEGLQRLAVFFPALFLTISALSVYNLLSRMVHGQRSQIGFLRAVGFTRRAIAWHYLHFSLLVGASGGIIGAVAGHYLGIWMTRLYTGYIQVPYYDVSPRWGVVGAGVLLSGIVTAAAGLFPSLAAAKLPPAQAIAVEVPMAGRSPLIERHLPFLRRVPLLSRLPLRNFLRNPRRSLSTAAGVASAATLILVSSALLDSTLASIDFYFKYTLHWDVLASYLHPQSEGVAARVEQWKGVKRVEPALVVPAKLVKGDESQTILLYGLRPQDSLLTLADREGKRIPLAGAGIMVADSTAKKLSLWEGGTVRLTLPRKTIPESPEVGVQSSLPAFTRMHQRALQPSYRETVFASSRARLETSLDREVRVSGVTYQPFGGSAFASIEEVRKWYGTALEMPPKAISTLAIEADPKYVAAIERELYDLEGIASVEVTRYIEEEIAELLKSSQVFFNVMLAFSVGLAAIIMFNSTLMNVIERTREIATLRTIGLGARAASWMVLAENLMAYACGMVVGIPFGTWLAGRFVQMYESESFNMQAVIYARSYWFAFVGILLTVLFAQLPGLRHIRRIELATATKDVG